MLFGKQHWTLQHLQMGTWWTFLRTSADIYFMEAVGVNDAVLKLLNLYHGIYGMVSRIFLWVCNLPWPWKICFNGRLLASSLHWSPLTMDQKGQLGLLLRSGCSCSVVLRRGPEVLIVTILSLLRWKHFQRVNFWAAIPKDHAAQALRSLVPETPCVMVCDIHQPAILMFFFLKQIQCMKFSLDVSFIYKYLESRAA